MIAELVVTGSELTHGRIVDTNSAWLLERLRAWGADPRRVTLVGDDAADLSHALAEAAARADLVVVSGGLGPTSDDLTVECAARVAGLPLEQHAPTLERIAARLARRGRTMTPMIARQALVPAGAAVLVNEEGTAPALHLRISRAETFLFAGVPREFRHLCDVHLKPFVLERRDRFRASRTLRCVGVPESELDARLLPLARAHRLELGMRAAWPEAWAILSGEGEDERELETRVDSAVSEALQLLGDGCFSSDGATLPESVARAARATNAIVSAAESCTGGLAGAALTEVPGSSAWFVGGLVTYSNHLKSSLLGVAPELIAAHGAVSEPVARAMAEGARERLGATHALSITGIAGPGGGTPEKPVGTVWIAVAGPSGTRVALLQSSRQDRTSVRELAVASALDLLRRTLLGLS